MIGKRNERDYQNRQDERRDHHRPRQEGGGGGGGYDRRPRDNSYQQRDNYQ